MAAEEQKDSGATAKKWDEWARVVRQMREHVDNSEPDGFAERAKSAKQARCPMTEPMFTWLRKSLNLAFSWTKPEGEPSSILLHPDVFNGIVAQTAFRVEISALSIKEQELFSDRQSWTKFVRPL